MRRLFFAAASLLLPFLASAATPPPAPALGLAAAFTPAGDIEVTFRNTGSAPCALNLGLSLGNGQSLWPTALSLLVTPKGGTARELTFKGGPIGGRVDDFLLPLPAGASYTLPISPTDFILKPNSIPATPQQPPLPGESIQVRLTPVPATLSPPPTNLWSIPLTSATTPVPPAKP